MTDYICDVETCHQIFFNKVAYMRHRKYAHSDQEKYFPLNPVDYDDLDRRLNHD